MHTHAFPWPRWTHENTNHYLWNQFIPLWFKWTSAIEDCDVPRMTAPNSNFVPLSVIQYSDIIVTTNDTIQWLFCGETCCVVLIYTLLLLFSYWSSHRQTEQWHEDDEILQSPLAFHRIPDKWNEIIVRSKASFYVVWFICGCCSLELDFLTNLK